MSRAAAKLKPLAPRPVDAAAAASKQCTAAVSAPAASSALPMLRCGNANAFAGCNIGVPCSPLEAVTSVDPKDYVWGTPSPQQQQLLFQQFLQMHFLYHIQMSQQAGALAGNPMTMPLHAFPLPPNHLVAPPHCAIMPGLSPMPGFIPAGHSMAVRPISNVPHPVSPRAAEPQPPAPEPVKAKAAPAATATIKEEDCPVVKPRETSTTTSIQLKDTGCGDASSALESSSATGAASDETVLSYLDKSDLFDCVPDFHMDVFDAMLSDQCGDDLSPVIKEEGLGLYVGSIPSPSGSDGSTETVAAPAESAADSPTCHEALSFLEGGVEMLQLPEESTMACLDYAADFKDVADFEFADLDEMVGLDAAAASVSLSGSDVHSRSKPATTARAVKLKKGSGIQKPSSRRGANNSAVKGVLSQSL